MSIDSVNASASPEVQMNDGFTTLEHQAVYGKRPSTTTGLTWGYYGGRWGGVSVAAGTLALTNTATNYLVVLKSTGAQSVSTASTNWDNTELYARVYKLTTAGGVVTATEDHRAGLYGVLGFDTAVLAANEATDTSCFVAFVTAASGQLQIKTNTNLTFNSNTGMLTSLAATITTLTATNLSSTVPTTGWYSPSADNIRSPNSVTVDDNLTVSGTGPNAIGGATDLDLQLYLRGTFTAGSTNVVGLRQVATYVTPANGFAAGMMLSPTLNKAGSGTHADFATVILEPPTIGAGAAALTNASTLKIAGAPTGATNNYALWVLAGTTLLSEGVRIGANSTNNLIDDATTGAGTATLYIGNASINVTSDENLKSNIVPLNDGLSILNQLMPIEYDQDEERPFGHIRHYVGFGARHSQKIAPWTVHTQGDTGLPWKMRQEFLMAPAVRAIQQLDARLKSLEARMP